MAERIIGVDPSAQQCGVAVIDNGQIIAAFNTDSGSFYSKITNFLIHRDFIVVFEDLRPYTTRLTMQVIDTAKFIGEAVYVLKSQISAPVKLIPRSEVKKWCFDTFPEICLPIINEIIEKKGYKGKDGEYRKSSFVFCNDTVIKKCMINYYRISKPERGYGYDYGLKEHSWQALALATCFCNKPLPEIIH